MNDVWELLNIVQVGTSRALEHTGLRAVMIGALLATIVWLLRPPRLNGGDGVD